MISIRRTAAVCVSILGATVLGTACSTSTSTDNSGDCVLDDSVGCGSGMDGWTCPSGDVPQLSSVDYVCSDDPDTDSNGNDLYCCADSTFASDTCGADSSVGGCPFPSVGFSCDGDFSPDQEDSSLACDSGTAAGSVTIYCCT